MSKKDIIIILGPTNNSKKVSTWESVTENINDVWIVPESFKFEKNNYYK